MKKVGFFNQLHGHNILKVNGIHRQVGGVPMCRKCLKPIPQIEIKDRGPNPDRPMWFEIWAKCHGEEDYSRVECTTPMPPNMWGSVISSGNFFDSSHEDDSRIR